jgi:hypothetical protein
MDQRALLFSLVVAVVSAYLRPRAGVSGDAPTLRRDEGERQRRARSAGDGGARGQVAVSRRRAVIRCSCIRLSWADRGRQAIGRSPVDDDFDPSLMRIQAQFFQQVAERARAVPGVANVTMTASIPC